jgi:hypothetical protein
VIECMIYTQTTKEKVIKPSQWKDDMYISLTWNDNNDFDPSGLYDDDGICQRCGYDHCECD